jgi:hypothetical protein
MKEAGDRVDQSPAMYFEDIPLEQARHMGRGSRMEPMLMTP